MVSVSADSHAGLAGNARDAPTSTRSQEAAPPLAIIGWSHRFPGEATSPEGFWDLLCHGRTAHGRVPADRFNVDAYYHPDTDRAGSTNTRHAHFLEQDLAAFDAPFFSIQPAEAATMDPQQRLLLETAYHAIENAGISIHSLKGSSTSVYVGASAHDYEYLYTRDPECPPKYLATGLGASILPSRVSWFFDLLGEAVLVDTACSSSLTALHLASQGLRTGETDMALVGAVNLMFNPDSSFSHLASMGFFSPDGRSYSFDSRANGYAKGEGTGFAIVRRLDDALRDGNTIRAVIRGTATNQDGRTPGITQPSSAAQESNIRSLYQRFGLDPGLTRFVEAHGTGTQVGDPLECGALARAFKPDPLQPLLVGAVKTNIGHLEAVAGLAGLFKCIMILEKGMIPPNALYESPNLQIPAAKWGIQFPTSLIPWPVRGLRRASLNSFGYGGTNTHAILDDAYHYLKEHGLHGKHNTIEYPNISGAPLLSNGHANGMETVPTNGHVNGSGDLNHKAVDGSSVPKIFMWSAADESGAKRIASTYSKYVKSQQFDGPAQEAAFLRDLSHTLSTKRTTLPWKTFAFADSLKGLHDALETSMAKPVRSSAAPRLVFVFTGQGAQWAGMAKELVSFATFEYSLLRAEMVLNELGCEFSLTQELCSDKDTSRINDPLVSQTLSTAVQLALVDLLTSWDIISEAVVGHSSGEIAAAYAVGDLDFSSALKAGYYRGYCASNLVKSKAPSGSMMSIALSPDMVKQPIEEAMAATGEKLVIGCENSPTNVTVSGDRVAIEHLGTLMDERGIFSRQLNVPLAYHSPHIRAIMDQYRALLLDIGPRTDGVCKNRSKRQTPVMFSSVTGERILPEAASSPEYWVQNAVSTVKFSPALKNLSTFLETTGGHILTLEVGPHSALKRPIKDTMDSIPGGKSALYESVLERKVSAVESCLNAVARMRCHGLDVDLDKINYPATPSSDFNFLVNAPSYPFNHSQTYWHESRLSRSIRFREHPRHELFGVPSHDWNSLEPHWRHFIKVAENPWIKDHHTDSANNYPAAGMITMVIEAARQLQGSDHTITGYLLKDILFSAALKVNDTQAGVEVQLRFHRPKHALGKCLEHYFALFVYQGDAWVQCCRGTVIIETTDEKLSDQQKREHQLAVLRAAHEASKNKCTERRASEKFYDDVARYGHQYGPSHRCLKDITHSQHGKEATAKMMLDGWMSQCEPPKGDPQPHVIHPTALDGIAHLSMASFSQSGRTPFPTMIPVTCRSIWVSNDLLYRTPGAALHGSARTTFQGFREADFTITAYDERSKAQIIVEDWRHMAVTNLGSPASVESARQLCYGVNWDIDVDLLTSEAVHKYCSSKYAARWAEPFDVDEHELPSQWFTHLIVEEADKRNVKGFGAHTEKYIAWARRNYDEKKLQQLVQSVPNGEMILGSDAEREKFFDGVASRSPETGLAIHTGRSLLQVLHGELNPLDLIYRSGVIDKAYGGPSYNRPFGQLQAYVELLAHKTPNLRILEVGGGTAAGTRPVFDAIAPRAEDGTRVKLPRFERYDFTDISPQFFESARELFPEYPDRFFCSTLDMEKDAASQGFEVGTYDVVYCDLVVHALSDLAKALQNARKLLKTGGKLILLELTNPDCARSHVVFGLLPGWWVATEDLRKNGPLVTAADWDVLLKENGFSGVDICLSDTDSEDRSKITFEVMVGTAIDKPTPYNSKEVKTVIITDRSSTTQQEVANRVTKCRAESASVQSILISDVLTTDLVDKDCIVLLELDRPWLQSLNSTGLEALKKISGEAKSVVWPTTGTGIIPTHPNQELVSGVGRTVRSEYWTNNFTHLALESNHNVEEISNLILRFHGQVSSTPAIHGEDVVREHDGQFYIGRVHESEHLDQHVYSRTVQQPLRETSLSEEGGRPLMLTIGSPGQIETLHFADDNTYSASMPDTHVEIQPAAVGVNFRDVLISLGKMSASSFGFEFAGTVTRTDAQKKFNVGDRVMGLMPSGAFKTHVRVPAEALHKIEGALSFEEAAAMPLTFATAYYSLVTKANVQRGETVLIHGASGGVGQSAIQVAKHLGARIFVTVGTEEKKQFLMDNFDIPANHVFHSRTNAFADSIQRLTNSRGVDVVLNSLSGDLLDASWSILAPLGRFVEIGKSDFLIGRDLQTAQFLKNVSFISVDMNVVYKTAPKIAAQVLQGALDLHSQGRLNMSKPLRIYHVGELEAAFRSLQSGKLFGKAVVKMDRNESIMAIPSSEPTYSFPANATYVVAGGFGGIGSAFVKWMASRGACNFVIPTSTQNPDKAIAKLQANIGMDGVRILGEKCDIADGTQLAALIKKAEAQLPPIKGCIQSTLMLRDGLLQNLTVDDWTQSIRPKVMGTWNLHELLPKDMDFFVAMSSIASITGSRGQSNYAAGNAFKDSVVRYRLSQGQRAFSLNIGPISTVGIVAEYDLEDFMIANGFEAIRSEELLALLEYACDPAHGLPSQDPEANQVFTGLGGIRDARAQGGKQEIYWLNRRLFSWLRNYETMGTGDTRDARASKAVDLGQLLLKQQEDDASGAADVILDALMTKLGRALDIPVSDVEPGKPIHAFGVDSLVSLEIRYWFMKEAKANLAVLDIMGAPSLTSLSAMAWEKSAFRAEATPAE